MWGGLPVNHGAKGWDRGVGQRAATPQPHTFLERGLLGAEALL